jgi:hypothetical protein
MEWLDKVEVIERIKNRLLEQSVVKDEAWAYEVARRWTN